MEYNYSWYNEQEEGEINNNKLDVNVKTDNDNEKKRDSTERIINFKEKKSIFANKKNEMKMNESKVKMYNGFVRFSGIGPMTSKELKVNQKKALLIIIITINIGCSYKKQFQSKYSSFSHWTSW